MILRAEEGRAKSIPVVACQTCGGTAEPVRAIRARLFTVFMCDDCTMQMALMDETGREFKVSAVAMEIFREVA